MPSRRSVATCGLYAGLTADDLRAMGGGCSSPRWVCPVLDLIGAMHSKMLLAELARQRG